MNLETHDPALFRDILKAVAAVNEEPEIILDPEGFRVLSMNQYAAVSVDLYLSRGFFDSFNVVEEYRAAMNLKDFNKLLFNRKNGKLKDSSLSIHLEGYKATFTGTGKLSGVKTFNLAEPIPHEEPPTLNLVHNAKVRLVTDTLKKVIDDCTVDDNVMITVDPDKVIIRCVNGDYLEENTIDKYADDMLELCTAGKEKATYALEHLAKISRALVKISDVVTLEFSTNQPMKISADLPYESHLVYYIAAEIWAGQEPKVIPIPHEEPAPVEVHQAEEPVYQYVEPPAEIVAVEVDPIPQEDQLSPGELYLKYYHEALARHSAEAPRTG